MSPQILGLLAQVDTAPLERFFQPFAAEIGLRHGLEDSIALFTLGLARWVPIAALAPFLGSRGLPNPVKLGVAMTLSLFMLPLFSAEAPSPLSFDSLQWWALLLREIGVGLMLGFAAGLIFWGAEMGGQMIDAARGTTTANLLIPQVQIQSSLLGPFYFQLVLVLFIAMGGHRLFLEAVFHSYSLIPLFEPVLDMAAGAQAFIHMTAELFVFAIKIVGPGLVTVIFLDLVLGVANRMAPQLDVFFISLSLKSSLATLAIGLSLYFLLAIAEHSFRSYLQWLGLTVRQLGIPS